MNHHADIAFDIETAPDIDAVKQAFGDRQPFVDEELDNSQWKRQDTIDRKLVEWDENRHERARKHEQDEDERYAKLLSKATLRPEMCRVLCISYYDDDKLGTISWGDERQLLTELWSICLRTQQHGCHIYSASGMQFDVRMCWRRSLAIGLKFNPNLQLFQNLNRTGRPQIHRSFVDVSEIYAAGEYQFRISVNNLALAMGLHPKHEEEGVTGGNFWRFVTEDRERAERYALRDSELVWEIAQRMRQCGVWPNMETQ